MEQTALLINTPTTLALTVIALWLGYWINQRVSLFSRYNIPAAVSGGLPVSALVALIQLLSGREIQFDLELRNLLLIAFFSSIGLSSRLRQLLDGGRALAIMLGLAVVFLLCQNLVGTLLALGLDQSPLYGLIGGSISLAGGHGTALTWGALFEEHFALADASSLGLAMATAGLISGGLLGGPVAAWLIRRHGLVSTEVEAELPHLASPGRTTYLIDLDHLLTAVLLIALCFALGASVYDWLSGLGLRLPAFLTSMFLGIVLANLLDIAGVEVDARPVQLAGDLSLQLFLGMSLISLPLLSLQSAFGLIGVMLLIQGVVTVLFTVFLVFPLLGRNYDAACISAGFIGMGLGATPVGIANMDALTSRYGPSPKAYLVIPLLGAFFIDIANATLVQMLLGFKLFNP